MIIIDRRLGGILPYRTVFFPTGAALQEAADRLRPIELAQFFYTSANLDDRRVLRRYIEITACIDLREPIDLLLKRMAVRTRERIRQAERFGSRVNLVRNDDNAFREFLELYDSLARSKTGFHSDGREVSKYRQNSDVFVLYLDKSPILSHAMLRDCESGRVRLLHSVSRRFDDEETARLCGILNRFLHWHEMRLYRQEGFENYDFGGISADETDGTRRFKLSFGGRVVTENSFLCSGTPWLGQIIQGLFESLSARGRMRRRRKIAAAQARLAQARTNLEGRKVTASES
jgi:hypothetical protein